MLDGNIEAFVLHKGGMVGADPDGNVTFTLSRVDGSMQIKGQVKERQPQLDIAEIEKPYAEFCAKSTYSSQEAARACESLSLIHI